MHGFSRKENASEAFGSTSGVVSRFTVMPPFHSLQKAWRRSGKSPPLQYKKSFAPNIKKGRTQKASKKVEGYIMSASDTDRWRRNL